VAEHCELTADRERFADADAVVLPDPTLVFAGNTPPPERARPDQCWVAWSWESSMHFPQLDDPGRCGPSSVRAARSWRSTGWCAPRAPCR
jgi:hypothetical protein